MTTGALGKVYSDGEILVRQGDVGDAMFVIQEGQAEILVERDGVETRVRLAGVGEIIGEMAVFERERRSATVRAMGELRALTIDKRNFMRQIAEDPSVAFRVVQSMSSRIRELSNQIAELKGTQEE
ncbi:MAG: cyclic nucleotide-binding domain-containing protein [Acidobacteriota bacterium]|jgi:CRP-like cAMP-binding protein